MSKGTQNSYNRQVVKTLVKKYGLSDYYIRESVAGRKKGITPDKLKKEYKKLEAALESKEKEFLSQD